MATTRLRWLVVVGAVVLGLCIAVATAKPIFDEEQEQKRTAAADDGVDLSQPSRPNPLLHPNLAGRRAEQLRLEAASRRDDGRPNLRSAPSRQGQEVTKRKMKPDIADIVAAAAGKPGLRETVGLDRRAPARKDQPKLKPKLVKSKPQEKNAN